MKCGRCGEECASGTAGARSVGKPSRTRCAPGYRTDRKRHRAARASRQFQQSGGKEIAAMGGARRKRR